MAAILDYHWHDKRTRRFRRIKWLLFGGATLLLAVSIVLTVQEQREHEREAARLRANLEGLKAAEVRGVRQAEVRDVMTQNRLGQILENNHALQQRLAPFERLADQLFPNLPRASRLTHLEKEMSQLSKRTEAVERRLAPRSLETASESEARALLAPYVGQAIRIDVIGSDSESLTFGRTIFDALRAAGLSVPQFPNVIMTPEPQVGIVLEVSPTAPRGYAESLARVFWLAGQPTRQIPGNSEVTIIRVGGRQ